MKTYTNYSEIRTRKTALTDRIPVRMSHTRRPFYSHVAHRFTFTHRSSTRQETRPRAINGNETRAAHTHSHVRKQTNAPRSTRVQTLTDRPTVCSASAGDLQLLGVGARCSAAAQLAGGCRSAHRLLGRRPPERAGSRHHRCEAVVAGRRTDLGDGTPHGELVCCTAADSEGGCQTEACWCPSHR